MPNPHQKEYNIKPTKHNPKQREYNITAPMTTQHKKKYNFNLEIRCFTDTP